MPSPTLPLIPIGNQPSFTFFFPHSSSFLPFLPICFSQILQLTSPLISKMSSAGTVESGKPPKVGHFSNTDTRKEEMNKKKKKYYQLVCNNSQSLIFLSVLLLDWLRSGGDREGSAWHCCLYRRHPLCLWEVGGCHTKWAQRQERWYRAGETLLHLWGKSRDICQTVPG